MATAAEIIQAISSTLFRISAFLFLRVIPARIGYKVLPTYYAVYVLSFVIGGLSSTPSPKAQENPVVVVIEDDSKDESTSAVVVAEPLSSQTPTKTGHSLLNTILFTLPSKGPLPKLVSFLINTALALMITDFLFSPLLERHEDVVFTRVGAVYSDAVKIVVRHPSIEGNSLRIVWKQAEGTNVLSQSSSDESGWFDGPLLHFVADQDWVDVARLDSLWASTEYQYRLAYPNSTLLSYPSSPITFKTFPDPRIPGVHFKFLASSCILPNFPYVPFSPSTRIKGFELLSEHLYPTSQSSEVPSSSSSAGLPTLASLADAVKEAIAPVVPEAPYLTPTTSDTNLSAADTAFLSDTQEAASSTEEFIVPEYEGQTTAPTPIPSLVVPSPSSTPKRLPPNEFMLLLGDFVYADVPYSVDDTKEEYNRLYRRNYASKDFRKVYEKLPIINIYDDHEISNNFNGYSNDSVAPFPNASEAYSIYNGQANYDSHKTDANGQSPNYFEFQYGDVAFFVLDTRRYRSVVDHKHEDGDLPTILGDKQLSDFNIWLSKVNSTAVFKFVISSVPFSALWKGIDGQVDTWIGAERERTTVLDLLSYVPNVILISGDRHEFAAVEYLGGVPEFSISPLSQFYIPYIRTFYQEHGQKRAVRSIVNATNENGTVEAQEVIDYVSEEKILKYLPHGNYKWASFEVDTTDAEKPTVSVEVTIEGKKAWEYTITGKPIRYVGGSAIGSQITEGLKGVVGSLKRLTRLFG